MNQISRCMVLIWFAVALAGWSAGSAAWNKGVPHAEPAPKASVASIEDALSGIAVSMPPRNPFAGYTIDLYGRLEINEAISDVYRSDVYRVPRTLADIANINDCRQIPKNLTEWVEENIETFSFLKDKRDISPGRQFAEETFQKGLPRHAAAF